MSSGFVSGGTIDQPNERDDEWRKAQQEIEERRRQKEEENRQGAGKSLYEVLQNNKAVKEEAFQESIKLKNQFRNLDEDEVEFLDSVLESTRAKEKAVKKETSEQLEIFRRQQEEADRGLLDGSADANDTAGSPTGGADETPWAVSARKRKRLKDEKGLKGTKLRKSSATSEPPQAKPTRVPPGDTKNISVESEVIDSDTPTAPGGASSPKGNSETLVGKASTTGTDASGGKSVATTKPSGLTGLGLGDYSSDED